MDFLLHRCLDSTNQHATILTCLHATIHSNSISAFSKTVVHKLGSLITLNLCGYLKEGPSSMAFAQPLQSELSCYIGPTPCYHGMGT